jgi:hypothetical protein
MKRHYYYFLLLLFIAFSCGDKLPLEGALAGKVLDQLSNKPIIGAKLQLTSNQVSITATTDEKGMFIFENILLGDYKLNIQADDYYSLSNQSIIITGGQTTNKDILLKPKEKPYISQIKVTNFPLVDRNGIIWDFCNFTDPDLYLIITTIEGVNKKILYNGKTQDKPVVLLDVKPQNLPFWGFTTGFFVEKNKDYSIEIWDSDGGLCGEDDFIGSVPFNISRYKEGETKATMSNLGVTMEFELIWK